MSLNDALAIPRNTLILSLLLGLTWILQIPPSLPFQWIGTILNCCQGLYILLYSILTNRAVRGQVAERISEAASTYMPSKIEYSKKSRVVETSETKTTEDEGIVADFSKETDSDRSIEPLDLEENQLENLRSDKNV